MKDANGPYIYNGVDRIDNKKGYEPGNCVPACKMCNTAKSGIRPDVWCEWINRLVSFRSKLR